MLAAAEAADAQEDETFGKDKHGDEMPDWAGDKAKRLAKIQEAMAAPGGRRQAGRGGRAPHRGRKRKAARREGWKKPGKRAAPPSDEPIPRHSATSPIRKAAS